MWKQKWTVNSQWRLIVVHIYAAYAWKNIRKCLLIVIDWHSSFAPVNCPTCHIKCMNKTVLEMHISSKHTSPVCSECGYEARTSVELENHKFHNLKKKGTDGFDYIKLANLMQIERASFIAYKGNLPANFKFRYPATIYKLSKDMIITQHLQSNQWCRSRMSAIYSIPWPLQKNWQFGKSFFGRTFQKFFSYRAQANLREREILKGLSSL